jgi:hypothetical protein
MQVARLAEETPSFCERSGEYDAPLLLACSRCYGEWKTLVEFGAEKPPNSPFSIPEQHAA